MKSIKFIAASIALAATAAVHAGPTSKLYLSWTGLTSGPGIAVVQGNSVVSTFGYAYGGAEVPIAVDGDVRTAGYIGGSPRGGQYTLGGTPTGTSYSLPAAIASAYDSTTDGSHNYFVDHAAGGVYATDRDYSNLTLLFNLVPGYLGITYDETNNSLWISSWFAGPGVANYSLTGTLLSSFSTGHFYNGALALDHADQTLWLVDNEITGNLEQFSKSGVFLSTGLNAGLTYGGEFDLASARIPEPSSILLLGTAALLLARQRRRLVRE